MSGDCNANAATAKIRSALRRLSYLYQTTRGYLNLLSFSALPFAVSQPRLASRLAVATDSQVRARVRARAASSNAVLSAFPDIAS